jgi:hypothetical protein
MFKSEIVNRHARAASAPMQWGRDDCCQFVRAIVLEHGGPDIMTDTFDYHDREGARLAMGGCLIQQAMIIGKKLGFARRAHPFKSDEHLIGIVAGEQGPTMALRCNGGWIARAKRGVAVKHDRDCVMAWRVECQL